jgi:hypothetical protein
MTASGAKKAKSNFEKVAKKKPDPAGLALAEQAQAAGPYLSMCSAHPRV